MQAKGIPRWPESDTHPPAGQVVECRTATACFQMESLDYRNNYTAGRGGYSGAEAYLTGRHCPENPAHVFLSRNPMKSSQVTIVDIARELHISPSTVSRALKGDLRISDATRRMVSELAAKRNYLPNSVALSLVKSRTNTIGVIIPEIAHHFFSAAISGIEDIAYASGYHVMICQSNESHEREVANTQALISSRVDGLIVSVSSGSQQFGHFERLHEKGIPLVFFDRICENMATSRVIVDDYEGAYMAVEHLLAVGCRRIAHLAGPLSLLITHNRLL